MRQFFRSFKEEARRQRAFTNSFWRQLAVILISIIIIQLLGPYIIFYGTNITARIGFPHF